MRGNRLIIIIVIFILLMGAAGVVAANNSETIQITNETSLLDVSPIIVVNETFDQGGPSLIFEDNHFCISYHSNEKGNWDIFIRKYDLDWNPITELKQVTTDERAEAFPSITFGNNSLYIAYHLLKEEEYTWARIPHFYYNFYVFQYSTSFTAAQAIADKILQGESGIVDKYIRFLSSGCSEYAIPTLRKVGVDMTGNEPFDLTIKRMNIIMDEIEEIIVNIPGI